MEPLEPEPFCPALAGTFQRSVRILLVDDDMINRKYGSSLLIKLGCRVDMADSGKAAIRKLGTENYDIVLMDVQMPLMDGYGTTRIIRDRRSDVRDHDIPIIAITANAMEGDREKCLEAKMNDYVTKPIDPEQLARAIFRQLGRTDPETMGTGVKDETSGADAKTPLLPDRFRGNEALYRKFLNLFCNEFPSHIEEMKEAWENNNAGLIGEIGHKIKGRSALFEADSLRDCAFELEKAGKDNDLTVAGNLIAKLEKEYHIFISDPTILPFLIDPKAA